MTCEQCGADIRHRQVTLDLGAIAKKHTFCSDGCKQRWTENQLRRWATFWNRIYINTRRGWARTIAHIALHTNEQP